MWCNVIHISHFIQLLKSSLKTWVLGSVHLLCRLLFYRVRYIIKHFLTVTEAQQVGYVQFCFWIESISDERNVRYTSSWWKTSLRARVDSWPFVIAAHLTEKGRSQHSHVEKHLSTFSSNVCLHYSLPDFCSRDLYRFDFTPGSSRGMKWHWKGVNVKGQSLGCQWHESVCPLLNEFWVSVSTCVMYCWITHLSTGVMSAVVEPRSKLSKENMLICTHARREWCGNGENGWKVHFEVSLRDANQQLVALQLAPPPTLQPGFALHVTGKRVTAFPALKVRVIESVAVSFDLSPGLCACAM